MFWYEYTIPKICASNWTFFIKNTFANEKLSNLWAPKPTPSPLTAVSVSQGVNITHTHTHLVCEYIRVFINSSPVSDCRVQRYFDVILRTSVSYIFSSRPPPRGVPFVTAAAATTVPPVAFLSVRSATPSPSVQCVTRRPCFRLCVRFIVIVVSYVPYTKFKLLSW